MDTNKSALTPIKSRITKMDVAISEVDIKDNASLEFAVKVLSGIKDVQKEIKEWKDTRIKPIKLSVKKIEADIKPSEDRCKDAENIIKGKMGAYYNEVEDARRIEEAKVAKQVEAGTIKVETAAKKLEKTPEARSSVVTDKGSISVRKVKKVRFAAISQLPEKTVANLAVRGYLIWDEVKVRRIVLDGQDVTGVEVYEENQVSAR